MAPFEAFADAPIEGVEGHAGMDQQATHHTGADQDVPLTVAMDAIAGLEHRAAFGQTGVVTHLLLLGAGLTRLFFAQADHFAPKLLAFDEADRITAPRLQAGTAVLQGVANVTTIYNKLTFSDFSFGQDSLNMYVHEIARIN